MAMHLRRHRIVLGKRRSGAEDGEDGKDDSGKAGGMHGGSPVIGRARPR